MQKQIIIKVFITVTVTAFLLIITQPMTANAQEPINYSVLNIHTQITPALLELEMRPGEVRDVPVLIENTSTDYSQTSAYLIKPQTISSQKFEIQTSTENLQNMDKWLQTEEVSLNKFNIKITIPKEIKPGQYYPIVIFSPYSKPDSNNADTKDIAITSELSTTFFINVINDFTDYKAKIAELYFKQSNPFSFPSEVNYTIKNTGDTFFRPRGEITITSPNGNVLAEKYSLNNDFNIVLAGDNKSETFSITSPKSDLNINNIIEQFKATGKYKISIEAVIEQNQTQKVSEFREFYYIPTSVVIVSTLLALLLILIVIIVVKRVFKKSKA